MKANRIRLSDRLVLYDHKGTLLSTRAYWLLYAFGHRNMSVLSGGYNKWVAEGKNVDKWEAEESDYNYKLDPSVYTSFEQATEATKTSTQIVDARGEAMYE